MSEIKSKLNRDSYLMILVVLVLTLFSLLMVESAASLNERFAPFVLRKQFTYIVISWFFVFVVSKIDYQLYEKFTYYFLI